MFHHPYSLALPRRGESIESKTTEPSYYYTSDKEKGVLEVELPGVPKEDVMIEVHGHHLHVSAKRYRDKGGKDEKLVVDYELDLRLGHDADTDAVKGVGLSDGVLVVHIPIVKKDQPRRITID